MSSLPDYSEPILDSQENLDAVIDSITVGLNLCKYEYEEKEKENSAVLDKLGFSINDLSEDMKKSLKNLFEDNEVLNFEHYGQKELVNINVLQSQESLVTDDELVEIEFLSREADIFFKKVEDMHSLLQRKLDEGNEYSKYLSEKFNDKAVEELFFKKQMEKKEHELSTLNKITKDLEQPKFSWEEVQSLQSEEKKLRDEVAILEAKLAKYHSLPLDEKAAAQLLVKLKEEMWKVDNEIKLKLSD